MSKKRSRTVVVITRSRNGRWYISSRAGNHERGPGVQSYTRSSDAMRGARRWFPDAEIKVVLA
jgi:hypothetical protein